jgi:hypothetical protein
VIPVNPLLGAEKEIRDAFRAISAVSPATARAAKDLPQRSPAFDTLVRRGVIRDGAPGTFYLYEPARGPRRWAFRLIFWALVIFTPVLIIQYCAGVR